MSAPKGDARLAIELARRLKTETCVHAGAVSTWLLQNGYTDAVDVFVADYDHLFEHRSDNCVYLRGDVAAAVNAAVPASPAVSDSNVHSPVEDAVVRRAIVALEGGPVHLTAFYKHMPAADMEYIRKTHKSLKRFLEKHDGIFLIRGVPSATETCELTAEGRRLARQNAAAAHALKITASPSPRVPATLSPAPVAPKPPQNAPGTAPVEEAVVRRVIVALEQSGPVLMTGFFKHVRAEDMDYIRTAHASLKRFLAKHGGFFKVAGPPGTGKETCSLTPEGRAYARQLASPSPAAAVPKQYVPLLAQGRPGTPHSTGTPTKASEPAPSPAVRSASPSEADHATSTSAGHFLQLDDSSERVQVYLVETRSAFVAAKARLQVCEAIAVDCKMDGTDNSARLALVQVYISGARPCINAFDVLSEIGREAVEVVWRTVCNSRVRTTFRDGRRDIDALRRTVAQYGSATESVGDVGGVVDIQVLHGLALHFRGEATGRRAGFDEIMEFVGLPSNPLKEAMGARFERGDLAMWTRRPLERDLLTYAAWDVLPLLPACERLERIIAEAAVGLARRSSAIAADELRQTTYRTRGGSDVRLGVDYAITRFDEYRNAFEYVLDEGDDGAASGALDMNDVAVDDQESTREAELIFSVLPEHLRRTIEAKVADLSRVCGEPVAVCEIRVDEGKPVSVLFNDAAETQHTFDGVACSVAEVVDSLRAVCARKNGGGGENGLARTNGSSSCPDTDGDAHDAENKPCDRRTTLLSFGPDNRVGIEGTFHRIIAMRDKAGNVVGLTLRLGHGARGAAYILRDVVAGILPAVEGRDPQSLLLVGRPGVGKTTYLRDIARRLADDHGVAQRVLAVDTSGELGGEGRVSHSALGRARRMHVTGALADALFEAQNHNPRALVVDDISDATHVTALRAIAQRGTALVGTAHGTSLVSLLRHPDLRMLVGDITVINSEDARDRGDPVRKAKAERKGTPVFSRLIEVRRRGHVAIHWSVAGAVDAVLSGDGRSGKGVVEERWFDPSCHAWKARFSAVARDPALADVCEGDGNGGSGSDGGDGWISRLLSEVLGATK